MSSKLNCICIDDELPALKLIETYCDKIPEINLMESFHEPIKALEFIKNNRVDLAIMDIQMPQLNGLEFYKQLDKNTLGIFISANPVYAIDAYEIDIIDFILKPASFERFEKAINKVLNFLDIKEDYLTIKEDYISKKIKISDISYVEAAGEYLKIVTSSKSYMQFQRLKDFEAENMHFGFIRIHKSYLVLKEKIYSSNFSSVTLDNGKILPLGRVYKDVLKT